MRTESNQYRERRTVANVIGDWRTPSVRREDWYRLPVRLQSGMGMGIKLTRALLVWRCRRFLFLRRVSGCCEHSFHYGVHLRYGVRNGFVLLRTLPHTKLSKMLAKIHFYDQNVRADAFSLLRTARNESAPYQIAPIFRKPRLFSPWMRSRVRRDWRRRGDRRRFLHSKIRWRYQVAV